jgi:hypothetical protein
LIIFEIVSDANKDLAAKRRGRIMLESHWYEMFIDVTEAEALYQDDKDYYGNYV